MSMHSPRRTPANKKPRGGGGSYHYRPKNKNGPGPSNNTNHNGNKSGGGGPSHSKYRDGKPPGMDSGPSDDGRPMDSDDKHHSFAKARSRYDRYDRFGSTSPRSSPKFGGQRQGNNRRGSGGNSDRPPPRDNRRGNGRSKFSGRAPYDDDDDEEEAFGGGRRPQRNQHKRNDRGPYERDFRRDRDNPRRDDRREDGPFDRGDRRYGYNDGGGNERGHHFRNTRPQNTHNRGIPQLQLDNLINIFHDQATDTPSMDQGKAISPPPTAVDDLMIYPIDWLMAQRKRPQHKLYEGPELPDSINRHLNPTPPPTDSEGPGMYRHKEPAMASRRPEVPQGSWRNKSPNVAPHHRDERDDPPKSDLIGSGDEEPGPSSGRRLPLKPPLHHGSAKTLDEAVARARETSEDEDHQPRPVQKKGRRSREKETPEWDASDAPNDMWREYTFRKLDRDGDMQSLHQTGQLLEAEKAVLKEKTAKRTVDNMPPLPVSAVDSASLERQISGTPREESTRETDPMNEDEASDPEIVQKQIEQMQKEFNEDDDEDGYGYQKDGDATANYAGLQGPALGVDQPDISNIANNPWHHLDLSGQPQPRPQSDAGAAKNVADLDLKAVMRDFQDEYMAAPKKPADKEVQDASAAALPLPGNKSRSHTPIGGTQVQPEAVASAEVTADGSPTSGKDDPTPRSGSATRPTDNTPTRVGEPSVSAIGDGQNGGNANQNNVNQVPTEEQFRLYEEKVRHYYYQSVVFHQKYKKYQKLYTHAHEVMMADPSQRDPHMEKYVEKYQQHRQRFQLVYEKYRRYKQYLEHFGRKVTIPTGAQAYPQFQHGPPPDGSGAAGAPGEYGGGEYGGGDPRQYYYAQPGSGGGHGPDGRYDPYDDHRHGPYGPGNGDPRYAMYYQQQQQQYYQRYRQDGYEYDARGPGPVPMRDQHDPRDPRDARDPRRGPPPPGHYANPMPSHGPPPRGHPVREEEFYEPMHPQIPKRVKGSAALKIEKPPRSSPGSQPNMEDDTKTTPTDPSAKKDVTADPNATATGASNASVNGKPGEKSANGAPRQQAAGERAMPDGFERFIGEDGAYPNGANPEYNEPPEYPANYFHGGAPPHDDRRGDRRADNGGIDLSDLGYTTAPIGGRGHDGHHHERERERDRRDPQMSGMAYPPGARVVDPVERSNRERAMAAQYADDYMKYYAHSSGGLTRREYEEIEHRQKRRHYLEHFRRYGRYPSGSHPRGHPGGHHPPRHDGQSPPMRQASPGHPTNEYYPSGYPPQGHGYDQGQYYRGASPSMDYQYYSSRGPPYEKE